MRRPASSASPRPSSSARRRAPTAPARSSSSPTPSPRASTRSWSPTTPATRSTRPSRRRPTPASPSSAGTRRSRRAAGESLFVAQVDFDETGTGDGRHGDVEILGDEGGEFAILSASPDAANQNAWIASLRRGARRARVRVARARRHGVRQRRRRRVVQPGAGPDRRPPGPQADHGADDGRHRRRRQGDAGRGSVRDGQGVRPRAARRDARRTPRTAAPRSSRCGASSTSATSRSTPPTGIATGELEAEEGATFTAGRMGDYTIEKDPTRDNGLRIVMGPFTVYDETNVGG